MSRYNTRDILGHYVKPPSKEGKLCPHACCRNKRVHPENYPVILPSPLLRKASDEDLAYHYEHTDSDRARNQVLYELERRDKIAAEKRDAMQRRKDRATSRKAFRDDEYTRIKDDAEAHTNGYLVNRQGRDRGITDYEILTGRESTFHRYASDEARNYFADNPRPTGAYFRGKDTRVGPLYSAPRRRRHPLYG